MRADYHTCLRQEHFLQGFVGNHPSFVKLVEKLKIIANKNLSVLLVGETGAGKGCCADFIHQCGDRFNGPFIPYNCSVGPDSLFESQLFGHAKGAFTGAVCDRPGLLEEAHEGILLLDEINSLSLGCQVKLNHFLESCDFRRVGENRLRKVDVRIISAANVDLHKELREGRFREDLYFRLAEYHLSVPPLRSRKQDISLLAECFGKKYSHLSKRDQITFTPGALKALEEYYWPGNVRELENVIKRCLIDSPGVVDMPLPMLHCDDAFSQFQSDNLQSLTWKEAKARTVTLFERNYLHGLLNQYHGVVAQCARHAGLHPPDFWKLMRKHDLKAQDFRSRYLPS
jgi:DNA-binding NtrC family response regulator